MSILKIILIVVIFRIRRFFALPTASTGQPCHFLSFQAPPPGSPRCIILTILLTWSDHDDHHNHHQLMDVFHDHGDKYKLDMPDRVSGLPRGTHMPFDRDIMIYNRWPLSFWAFNIMTVLQSKFMIFGFMDDVVFQPLYVNIIFTSWIVEWWPVRENKLLTFRYSGICALCSLGLDGIVGWCPDLPKLLSHLPK